MTATAARVRSRPTGWVVAAVVATTLAPAVLAQVPPIAPPIWSRFEFDPAGELRPIAKATSPIPAKPSAAPPRPARPEPAATVTVKDDPALPESTPPAVVLTRTDNL